MKSNKFQLKMIKNLHYIFPKLHKYNKTQKLKIQKEKRKIKKVFRNY